jgi:hypothetical protein
MFRRLRETGPGALVPAAWLVVAGAHLGVVSEHALFVSHLVMGVLLAAFAVTGWTEMRAGVLRTWRSVIAAGFLATATGVAGFLLDAEALLAVSLYAWLMLPALGLLRTGAAVDGPAVAYTGGGAVSALGLVVYALGPTLAPASTMPTLVGLALVGVGQTVGIVDAVARY